MDRSAIYCQVFCCCHTKTHKLRRGNITARFDSYKCICPRGDSTNQRPTLVSTDQSEARTCDKLFVNYWATVWSTYVTPSQATRSLTSLVWTLWLPINQLSGHRSQSSLQMQMIINADNLLTLSACSWIFTFYFGHIFTKSTTRNYLQALFLKPFSVSFRK